MDYEQLLLEHLELVDKISHFAARKHNLRRPDAEEFAACVRLKLVDDDYAVLRKFRGESTLRTYLVVVIRRLCQDFCSSRWGKWRVSSRALQLGPVVSLLEKLTRRDGLTFDEAVSVLQIDYAVSETKAELHAAFVRLAAGSAPITAWERRLFGLLESEDVADAMFQLHVDRETARRLETALDLALSERTDLEQLILRLRFCDGQTVPQLADTMGFSLSSMYRRLNKIVLSLRNSLLRSGIEPSEIARLVGHDSLILADILASLPRP